MDETRDISLVKHQPCLAYLTYTLLLADALARDIVLSVCAHLTVSTLILSCHFNLFSNYYSEIKSYATLLEDLGRDLPCPLRRLIAMHQLDIRKVVLVDLMDEPLIDHLAVESTFDSIVSPKDQTRLLQSFNGTLEVFALREKLP